MMEFAKHWRLDPGVIFLNHGSYGACPTVVLEEQRRLSDRLEHEPVRFFERECEPLLDAARRSVAELVGAEAEDLVFVNNATTGVNTVLRSLDLKPGDELLTTNHCYNACRNAMIAVADKAGAEVVTASVPFPVESPEEVVEAVLSCVTERTKFALLDHITSPTALVFPVKRLVAELRARGVETMLDGAHAPGQVPLNIDEIGATYYTGNCHKWLCAPKGVALLHVRRDKQAMTRPLVISHGANSPRTDRSRFLLEFDWTGTGDPTASLSLPVAINFLRSLLPGGLEAVMASNHAKVVEGRRVICEKLGIPPPCPEDMLGSLASIPLPLEGACMQFHERLLDEYHIEVPICPMPSEPKRGVRIAAQMYNDPGSYHRLADVLSALLSPSEAK